MFALICSQILLMPWVAVIDERSPVDRKRREVPVADGRQQPHRVLDANRPALVGERRALVIDVEIPAEIAADRGDLLNREAAAVGHPPGDGLALLAVRDCLLHRKRAAGTGGGRLGLVERAVEMFVDDRALDRPRGSEYAFRHVPFEGPSAGKVLVEAEGRLLVGDLRRPSEVRHLALGQRRLGLLRRERRYGYDGGYDGGGREDPCWFHGAKCSMAARRSYWGNMPRNERLTRGTITCGRAGAAAIRHRCSS